MKKIYFLLFTLLIASASFGQELLVNGTFEGWDDTTTPSGWSKAEDVEQESVEVHSGDYSAKHTGGTNDIAQTITGITPGTSYTVSIWYKIDAASGDDTDARIWSKWSMDGVVDHNTDADVLQGVGDSGYLDTNGNQWTQYTTTVTAPTTANEFYFEVRTYSGAVVYWDDFSFYEQAVATPSVNITPEDGTEFPSGTTTVDLEYSTFNIDLSTSGNQVNFTVNDDETIVDATSPYTIIVADGETYNVTADLLENNVIVDTKTISFSVSNPTTTTQVANITELRAGSIGDEFVYELTGEAIISYVVTSSTRNQKYIQDADAGILIDDADGIITTAFSNGDGMTGIFGTLADYNGLLQFIPTQNVASASSTGNTVTPIVVSAAELITNGEAYESRLITVNNVTFSATGIFEAVTNYDLTDGTDVTLARTAFSDEDLIGANIPTSISSVTGLGGDFNGTYQIFPRYASDIAEALSINEFNVNTFSLYPNPTNTGSVTISSTNSEAMSVQVFDILGKQVKNETLTNNTLNVANLKSGVYIVKITQNNATTTKKLVIK
ncbi:T9SS type A sorting domain-containing protein [Winogradskyella wichelsiae]|uniref:T9SS type A sorting domain-containing protein n=1 Tax=Winogradskyella wichelsiae TaxID=2697007 RepID=UPI003EFB1C8B